MESRFCEIITADPAKNITVFVLNEVRDRALAVRRIMADGELHAEQAGFVMPPVSAEGHWRLEMMGGEFCGNAARSFGLLTARFLGLRGKAAVTVEVSGMDRPLTVQVDMDADGFGGSAEIEIPGPRREESIPWEGGSLPALIFDGITHVIASGVAPDRDRFNAIKKAVEAAHRPDALGVMFWDSRGEFMTPAVYVYRSGTLVFESSCGSGSAALAVFLAAARGDGEWRRPIRQPGGIIETRLVRRDGGPYSVSIGGRVALSGKTFFPLC
jgi:diaminopimelate epimerase